MAWYRLEHIEWVYDFSLWGLVFLVPALALPLVLLDRGLASALRRGGRDRLGLVVAGLLVVLAGTVGDLVWGGTHTYLMRVLSRFPALLLVLVVAVAGSRLAAARSVNDEARAARRR